jgi:arsenate reductase-like glutaredoxin family protein
MSLAEIEALTTAFAARRRALVEQVQQLDRAVEDLTRARLGDIRPLADAAGNARTALAEAIEDAPHLFQRPRTIAIEGIKVGLRQGKRLLAYDDERLVGRIRERMPERLEELVAVIERPVRSRLALLEDGELRRLGVSVIPAGDEVVIQPVDGAVDKLVERWLQAAAEKAEAA